MRSLFIFFFALLSIQPGFSQIACPIIPLPQSFAPQSGSFLLSNNTAVLINDDGLRKNASFLQGELLKNRGIAVALQGKSANPAIKLILTKGGDLDEYKLSISPSEIKISSSGKEGIFYGINSFLQLARQAKGEQSVTLSCIEIKDKPEKPWRGLMIDEARHFYGKETIKNIIDWMAFYKLNKFHWHLSDVQGWRIEIKKYPKLALIGGIGNNSDPMAPAAYYTQEDIKEIVAYAADRYITVIPEIDMPGHARAANMAYPEFNGGGSEKKPDFTFNPGKEQTYTYLADILKEVNVLFPSGMIHLGGDEVSFGSEAWEKDASVKMVMQKYQLKDMKEVEDYFMKRMTDTVFSLNSKVLLWDEAATGDLSPEKTIICWWRHDKPETLKLALDKGYSVVLCPRVPLYFDFTQDSLQCIGRLWKGKITDIQQVYNYSPEQETVIGKRGNQILGLQGNLWTENPATSRHLQYMLFPRISALAEAAWTAPEKKNYNQFMLRLKPQLELYKKDNIYFYNPFTPAETPEPLSVDQIKLGSRK